MVKRGHADYLPQIRQRLYTAVLSDVLDELDYREQAMPPSIRPLDDALVMVDDSHAVGFLGPRGRGTHEYHDVMGRVDILTGTLGKALGGASGGYTSGRREIIALLRHG